MSKETIRGVANIVVMCAAYYFLGPSGAGLQGFWLGASVAAASMLGSYAINKLLPPTGSASSAAQQETSIATAVAGTPIPVGFGIFPITANCMYYDLNSMVTEDVKAEGGKGGGGGQTVGHKYFLPFEQGFCVGPVDGIEAVISSPGAKNLLASPVAFSSDTLEINLGEDDDKGGICRYYRGSSTQTRLADAYSHTGMNYRHLCWGMFGPTGKGFGLGSTKSTPSFKTVFWRLPVCTRDDGSTVAAIKTRGSNDENHRHYKGANPAAMYYEILTDKVWGCGFSSDEIDEASFADLSEYFAETNRGLNVAFDTLSTAEDIYGFISQHVKTGLVMDSGKVKIRCLLALENEYSTAPIYTEDDINDLEVQIPSYGQTQNRVIAEWTNPEFNYKSETLEVTDDANIEIQTIQRPLKVGLQGYQDANVVFTEAQRLLKEVAAPLASISFKANRRAAALEYGDLIRVYTTLWGEEGKAIIIAARVTKKQDASSESEQIQIEAIEDYAFPRVEVNLSETVDITTVEPFGGATEIDQDEFNVIPPPVYTAEEIAAPAVFEVPPILTGGAESRVILVGAKQGGLSIINVRYDQGGGNYVSLGNSNTFVPSGEFAESLPAGHAFDRSSAGVLVTVEAGAAQLLGSANKVDSSSDNLMDLIRANTDFIICGEEIIQVGMVDHVAGNTYRLRNFIRGRFGSKNTAHAIGEKWFFVQTINSVSVAATDVPVASQVAFRGYPVLPSGKVYITGDEVSTYPRRSGAFDLKHMAGGIRPLGPDVRSIDGAGPYTLKIRPRLATAGFGVASQAQQIIAPPLTLPATLSWVCDDVNAAGTVVGTQAVAGTYVTPTMTNLDSGIVEISGYAPAVGATKVRVYASMNGLRSLDYAEFTL